MKAFKNTALTVGITSLFAIGSTFAESPRMSDNDSFKPTYKSHAQLSRSATDDTGKKDWSDAVQDAWAQGKLEGLFLVNEHLSAYKINTDVKNKAAHLTGTVKSHASKELAQEVAQSVEGIDEVKNDLEVEDNSQAKQQGSDGNRDLGTVISDATITASVKIELAASRALARDINVDTERGVVTLTGTVENKNKKELALQIAKNVEDVQDVRDKLEVKDAIAAR